MRPVKITFGEMRSGSGPTGILVYCQDYRCSHSIEMSAEQWPDDVRLSDIEPRLSARLAASAAPTCGLISNRPGWALRPSVRCACKGCARSQSSTRDQRSIAARRAPSAGWASDCPKGPKSPNQRQQRRRRLRIDPASWQPPSAPERQEDCHLGVIEKWPQGREPPTEAAYEE
jgi:hypothetical protein